ncbi:MAG: histidine kinase [Sandarakinorhabdus sp.]|nr:histidine kinase [Sandarakinorhabdus sp.]
MRRWLALTIALVALFAAGFVWTRDRPTAVATEVPLPVALADAQADAEADAQSLPALVAPVANLTPEQREARRFGRYDKNRDARIGRDEYLTNRKKAFAKLDTNGDGRLSFDEYTAKTVQKFAKADRNGDGALVAGEFAATAGKPRAKAACVCEKPAED